MERARDAILETTIRTQPKSHMKKWQITFFRPLMDEQQFINNEFVTIAVDPDQLRDLMECTQFKKADELLKSVFERTHRTYVIEKDELVSKRLYENKLREIKRSYEDKLSVKRLEDKAKMLCPECDSRAKWDGVAEEYVCSKCDWRGITRIYND